MTDQELINQVSVEVMGWKLLENDIIDPYWSHPEYGARYYKRDWNPLTNANHWMMVVEKMKTIIFSFKVWAYAQGDFSVTFTCDIQGDVASHTVKNKSIGHAVCLAALEAIRSLGNG